MLLRPPTRLGVLGLGFQGCAVEGPAVQSEAARTQATRHAAVVCLWSSPDLYGLAAITVSSCFGSLQLLALLLEQASSSSVLSANIRVAVLPSFVVVGCNV